MKRILALALLTVGVAALATSIGSRLGTSAGTGVKTFYTGPALRNVGMACPYQVVAWKSCQGSGGQLDAGLGGCTAVTTATGTITDFSLNVDPVQINMGGGDRVMVVNVDAGTQACSFYNLGP